MTLTRDVACPPPDFLEKHGAILLTILTAVGGGLGALLMYCLKSRCTKIDLCCFKLSREPIPVSELPDLTTFSATPPPSPPPYKERWSYDDVMQTLVEVIGFGGVQDELHFQGLLNDDGRESDTSDDEESAYQSFPKVSAYDGDIKQALVTEVFNKLDKPFWWQSDPQLSTPPPEAHDVETQSDINSATGVWLGPDEVLTLAMEKRAFEDKIADYENQIAMLMAAAVSDDAGDYPNPVSKKSKGTGCHGVSFVSGKYEVRMPRSYSGKHYIGRYETLEKAKSVAEPLWKAYYEQRYGEIPASKHDLKDANESGLPVASTGKRGRAKACNGTFLF
jgi:hypothetical protein